MNGDVRAVHSLYRTCLREIRRLPTEYLRQFFRLKFGDDARAAVDPRLQHLRCTKTQRILKTLRKLECANDGHKSAFHYILNTAYGRRGGLKWEIMHPLRTEPGAEPPPRIIRSVESSRPPIWSTEMQALVTSDLARVRKALKPNVVQIGHNLPPERLDPHSPQSRILGPFSKRREVNIRWRYFLHETQKTHYPLQTVLAQPAASDDVAEYCTDEPSLARAGIRSIGLQGSGVFEEAEALARPPVMNTVENSISEDGLTDKKHAPRPRFDSHLPQRFLRRRYQQLLALTPILTYHLPPNVDDVVAGTHTQRRGRYKVSISPNATSRYGVIQTIADSVDMAWIQHAKGLADGKKVDKGERRRSKSK